MTYTAQPGSKLYELQTAQRAAQDEADRLGDLLARREAELADANAHIDDPAPYADPAGLGEALALRGALLRIIPAIATARRDRLGEAEQLAGQVRNLDQAIRREEAELAQVEGHAVGAPRMAAHLQRRRAEYMRKMGEWVGLQPEPAIEEGRG